MKSTDYLTITERAGTSITVMNDSRGPLIVVTDGPGARAARYTPEEAAKFSLAILEAAGAHKDSQDFLGGAVEQLKFHIGEQERITAEDRVRAELEAEALELFRAFQHVRTDGVFVSVPSFASLSEPKQAEWLAVARRAREMRTEK